MTEMFLTPNPWSRPGTPIGTIKGVVVHWVGNAGSTAVANRNYFESLKNGNIYASSHYIVGLKGEVIYCVPENEVAYHAKQANANYIGVETCHDDWDGVFNPQTYGSLVDLVSSILLRYEVTDVLRHFDVTEKICPKWFVEDTRAWNQFLIDVAANTDYDIPPYVPDDPNDPKQPDGSVDDPDPGDNPGEGSEYRKHKRNAHRHISKGF